MVKETNQELPALLDCLKRSRGFDFTGYKQANLTHRIQKRMQIVGINTYNDYIDYLEVYPDEFTQLFNTILINVTGFFRDPAAWKFLEGNINPRILTSKDAGQDIRIWSTGCASGEEAYSIAILLAEALGEDQFRERVKIYATDVDEDALAKARSAVFSEHDVTDVPKELLDRYFTKTGSAFSFRKELRRNLIFGRNDLIQDAPISRIDLIICRNTLIYFNSGTQARILARFHFAHTDTGFLFQGKAEMLLTHTNTFLPVDLKLRIFSKVPRVNFRDRLLLMTQTGSEEGVNQMIGMVRMRDMNFETGHEAQLVVDANSSLVMANARAREQSNISPRDVGRPFQDMEISYRPAELRSSIQRAYAEREPVLLNDIEWYNLSGESRFFDIRIQPLFDNGNGLLGASLSSIDVTVHMLLQRQL